jgi:hypothetical protein
MTAFDLLTLTIAVVALGLSAVGLWLAEFRRGRVLLSKPTIFFFGWDVNGTEDTPKILLRSALFSTGRRGHIVENLYTIVTNANGKTTFPFWGYDAGNSMVRGSGLFVGPEGHSAYHHFNPLPDDESFSYVPGTCSVEIWAEVVGTKKSVLLGRYGFDLPSGPVSTALMHHEGGVLWTWSPIEKRYVPEISPRPDLHSSTPVPGLSSQ